MKVAQYEVLGDDSIRDVRPGSRHFEAVINLTEDRGASGGYRKRKSS